MGCPTVKDESGKWYVDWKIIEKTLIDKGELPPLNEEL